MNALPVQTFLALGAQIDRLQRRRLYDMAQAALIARHPNPNRFLRDLLE